MTECNQYELQRFHRNISDEELFKNIAAMWERLGRQPRFRDCRSDLSLYSAHTYAARFGSWIAALERFVEWAANHRASTPPAPYTPGSDSVQAQRDIANAAARKAEGMLAEAVYLLKAVCQDINAHGLVSRDLIVQIDNLLARAQ